MGVMRATALDRDLAEAGERQRFQFVGMPGFIVIAATLVEAAQSVKEIYAGLAGTRYEFFSAPPVPRARDFKQYGVPGDTLPI